MTADPTKQLLRDWHAGKQEALDELVRRHLDWVRGYVHRRLGPGLRRGGDTQDFVQDAMVDVLVYGPQFEISDPGQFRVLLARIVENNLRDADKWLRRHRRDAGREQRVCSDSVLSLDPSARSMTTPSQAADRNESQAWIRLALELLEPEDREVIWLREWERLSFGEIGSRVGIAANAARMRFQRALPRLAEKIGELRRGQVANAIGGSE